jgi:aquaporin Z
MELKIFGAEFLGTFILVLSILATANPIYIAAAFLTAITIISKISGGHINPVVTIAMFMNGTISGSQVLAYIPAQVLGALAAYYAFKQI